MGEACSKPGRRQVSKAPGRSFLPPCSTIKRPKHGLVHGSFSQIPSHSSWIQDHKGSSHSSLPQQDPAKLAAALLGVRAEVNLLPRAVRSPWGRWSWHKSWELVPAWCSWHSWGVPPSKATGPGHLFPAIETPQQSPGTLWKQGNGTEKQMGTPAVPTLYRPLAGTESKPGI